MPAATSEDLPPSPFDFRVEARQEILCIVPFDQLSVLLNDDINLQATIILFDD